MNELVVAIDIGTSKICVLCGQINKAGQMDTLARSVVPCYGARKGLISDIDDVAGAIVDGIRQIETLAGLRVGSAYINVMGLHVDVVTNRSRAIITNDDREIHRKDVERLMYQVRDVVIPHDSQIIDIIPRQFFIDGYGGITEPVGMVGSSLELEADIVTGKISSISNIIRCIEKAGLKIDGLVISGQALSEIVLTREEREMGVIVIDVGGTVTDVSVFKGGRLCFYESLLVGGDTVTNDISYIMRVTQAEADKLKKDYELALASLIHADQAVFLTDIKENIKKRVNISEIVEVIEARVSEIIEMSRDLLKLNGIALDFSAGVVLTGGGVAYFDGVKQIANDVFGLPVKVYPARAFGGHRIECVLAEGIVRHVARTGKGTRYGSDVQVQKGRGAEKEDGLGKKIVDLLKRIF